MQSHHPCSHKAGFSEVTVVTLNIRSLITVYEQLQTSLQEAFWTPFCFGLNFELSVISCKTKLLSTLKTGLSQIVIEVNIPTYFFLETINFCLVSPVRGDLIIPFTLSLNWSLVRCARYCELHLRPRQMLLLVARLVTSEPSSWAQETNFELSTLSRPKCALPSSLAWIARQTVI